MRNPANQLTIYHYDEAGQLVAMERAGVRYLIATDQVGTPRVVRNAAGSVIKTLEYDSFGNLVSDSNPSFELPFGFAGGLADATTGLVRFGFRDYDPAAARWMAKDPVFFAGGQGNLYVYVGNNPIGLRDPLGQWCFGGSFYATLGGGAQYCLDREKGFSLCIEAGVEVGGDVNLAGGSIPDGDEIGFEFNPTCFGVGGTLACGFKICNGTATWRRAGFRASQIQRRKHRREVQHRRPRSRVRAVQGPGQALRQEVLHQTVLGAQPPTTPPISRPQAAVARPYSLQSRRRSPPPPSGAPWQPRSGH